MKIKDIGNSTYVVLLKKGEDLFECLKEFHQTTAKGNFCEFRGIGAITGFTLRYAFSKNGEIAYDNIFYNEEQELLSLVGNMALLNDETAIHAHATVSNKNNEAVGGDMNEAIVSIVCELFITVYKEKLNKVFDESVGLNVLDI